MWFEIYSMFGIDPTPKFSLRTFSSGDSSHSIGNERPGDDGLHLQRRWQRPEPVLPMGTSVGYREAQHFHSMAPSVVSLVLAVEISTTGASAIAQKHSNADHHHGLRESELG
jgi:hypothetical protein